MRGEAVGRILEKLGAAEEHWLLAAFAVFAVFSAVTVYWYMQSKMR